ncbi:lytic transglycosylase domain-containing protein [Tellurirhabdus rosea]|uniref:lytic transglycosylase domain-containing protein n=1 Tax=Tellurirhabdus rosea TaxID=2674997 RepID=UPI00225421B5|nr:lytic transglycosylase domain-containing protein [Tellurirhabdus rosea]
MIKETTISLLLSAAQASGAALPAGTDTTQLIPLPSDPVLLAVPGKEIAPVLQPVQFCGEEVPLYEASVTRRWIQVLLQQAAQREYLYVLRQKASRFFPIIEPIMARYGIPRDFKYLPLVESSLVSSAVSHKGAGGYWQLMPQTAREMGLRVDGATDERFNLQKSTVAACRYLRSLHKELGSWTLVAAAYNSGSGHVTTRMEAQGGQRSYYALRLHQETRAYLYRVLAYKELMTRPREYSTLLQPDVLAYLTFPLPRHKYRKAPALNPTHPPVPDTSKGDEVDPTWGPRNRNVLDEIIAQIERMEAVALEAVPVSSSSVTQPVTAQTAVMGLMGLRVLRFRRSRLYQVFLAAKRKIAPLFGWDWV